MLNSITPRSVLAVDEIILKFKGRAILRQYLPKKRKLFDIKIYRVFLINQGILMTQECVWLKTHALSLTT